MNYLRLFYSIMMIIAGISHFLVADWYLKVMPKYLPYPKQLVWISGLLELTLGMMMWYLPTHRFAVYGIIILLVVFLIVHVNMLLSPKASLGLPKSFLYFRLFMQFVIIYGAIMLLV